MDFFGKGASFSSFDLSLVLDADPVLSGGLMQAVHSYYRGGFIEPVRPFSATDVSKLDQVLLKFSKGTHIGKLVVTFQDPQTLVKILAVPSQPRVKFDPAACYIVVGGFGGLGRSIIRWMCERGGRNLVVLSRHGIEQKRSIAQNLIRTLTKRSICVQSFTCDISDRSQVAQIIRNISLDSANGSLKGIIHTAVSYLDLSFDKLTVPRWRDSLAAKVQGTRNLHEETLSLVGQLDFFVMITSLESVCALATQSAYTAANAFQDAFARDRRRLGMPATSISLGFVRGIVKLGQDSIAVDMFARNKVLTLSEWEFLARLEPAFLDADDNSMSSNNGGDEKWVGQAEDPLSASNILTCLDPRAMVAKERDEAAEAREAGLTHPSRSVEPRWYSDARVSLIMRAFQDGQRDQRMGSSSGAATSTSAMQGGNNTSKSFVGRARQQFDAAVAVGAPERSKTVEFVISTITIAVAEMLFVDVSSVNPARAVADHGVDSLIVAELRNWFYQALGVKINMRELLDADEDGHRIRKKR